MYIRDGIAFAGDQTSLIKVTAIEACVDYKLKLIFNDGVKKVVDFTPLLDLPCYKPLMDTNIFFNVSLEHGVPIWQSGEIDISPEFLYYS